MSKEILCWSFGAVVKGSARSEGGIGPIGIVLPLKKSGRGERRDHSKRGNGRAWAVCSWSSPCFLISLSLSEFRIDTHTSSPLRQTLPSPLRHALDHLARSRPRPFVAVPNVGALHYLFHLRLLSHVTQSTLDCQRRTAPARRVLQDQPRLESVHQSRVVALFSRPQS